MTEVQAVIFDIGNVLIEWQPERHYDRLIGGERRRAFFDEFDFHGLMNRIDEGAPFAPTIDDAAREAPTWATELLILRDNWTDLAQPAIPHSVRLLRALKERGVPVFVLSNFGAENFPVSQAQFPFLTEFDRFYISGRMKMRKPDPAIYAAVEADCGLPAQSLLFADDRAENIDAARARGWQTHLFTTPESWADCLVAAGLISREDAA
ncbi:MULTISPECIES: HAD family phosphatase [unclassified Roseovarius]|uniref:HAD family hydrolase n=1 Tax=unclassified Roseovarius TaxID=2614913 RepID=UPI00273FE870|nr:MULTISPECIES: HAD family phosphatase [unclassified Roseovarius]